MDTESYAEVTLPRELFALIFHEWMDYEGGSDTLVGIFSSEFLAKQYAQNDFTRTRRRGILLDWNSQGFADIKTSDKCDHEQYQILQVVVDRP